MTLSEYIIKYRIEHDLSQRQFAIKCNVSNGYIAMIEKNENPKTGMPIVPSIPSLLKICNGMGISMDDLCNSIDDMPLKWSFENEIKPEIKDDDGLNQLISMYLALNEDNRSKLLELSRLYLDAQHKSE